MFLQGNLHKSQTFGVTVTVDLRTSRSLPLDPECESWELVDSDCGAGDSTLSDSCALCVGDVCWRESNLLLVGKWTVAVSQLFAASEALLRLSRSDICLYAGPT